MKIEIVNLENKVVGSMDVPESVFAAKVNQAVVHQVVKAQLAGVRQGTAKNKRKAEVRGGGHKPFKQKGTGNARQGSSRSPLNPGGGSTFGPAPRDYIQRTPRKMVAVALRSVLSDKCGASRLKIIDSFNLSSPKTKSLESMLSEKFDISSALLVDKESNVNLDLAARNLPKVDSTEVAGVNVYDVLKYEWLLLSKEAVETLLARLS